MDPLTANFDSNCPYYSAGLELGSHGDHSAAVNAHPDSPVDPLDLDISTSLKEHLEQVANDNQIRSYLSLPIFKSLFPESSVPDPAESSSSSVPVPHNTPAPEMIDPRFLALFSADETLQDWCASVKRFIQLQEEEDQHRQVNALSYDLANDPELTVPLGDQKLDSDYEYLFSQPPSKRIRITTTRTTVACDWCRKGKYKVAPFTYHVLYRSWDS